MDYCAGVLAFSSRLDALGTKEKHFRYNFTWILLLLEIPVAKNLRVCFYSNYAYLYATKIHW